MALEGIRGTQLDKIWSSETERRPGWRVQIWNPRFASVQDVVRDNWEGPSLDISPWVSNVSLSQNQAFENNENAVSSSASLVIEIERGVVVDGVSIDIDQDLFRDGTPIRIYEGDRRVYRSEWPAVFTGVIRGFPGAIAASRGERARVQIQAYGRAQAYQRQNIVGLSWAYGTDLGDMAVDVAMTEMRLDRDEIRFGSFDYTTGHKANALTQIGKMQGLFEIMHTVGRKPYFDARGFLVSHDTSFRKPPVLVFNSSPLVKSVARVQQLKSIVNSVQVIGLNSALTKIVSPIRNLSEINVTVGYFDPTYREDIYYSEDKSRRAENTQIHIASQAAFGASASWSETDEFHGRLTIDTGYSPWVVGYIITAWAVMSILEYTIDGLDAVQQEIYKPVRSLVQAIKAASMLALLVAMTKIGRWRIFVQGEVFEYVHEENRAIAVLKGVPTADVEELEVRLPWLDTSARTENRAQELLERELVKGAQYEIEVASHAILEVDDLIVIKDPRLPNDNFWTFYVTSIRKSFSRDQADSTMVLTAWHVREAAAI